MKFAKRSAGALLAVLLAAGLGACNKARTETRTQAAADPSAQVIGVKPADPTGDPPGTTPVAGNTTEVTKKEEISRKPQEGDDSSHLSVSPDNKAQATGKDPQQTPERKSQ